MSNENEKLEKKWKEALLGLGLATATPSMASEPEQQAAFDPKTLHHELHPIAHLESSFGQNMKHKVSSKGELDTAVGALGLKPTTAHEEYLRSPSMQKLHPHLHDIKVLLSELKTNPQFYNNIAATHWNRLKKLTGSPEKAAFAWRYGPGAAAKTPDTNIMQDKYVQKYSKLSEPEVKKTELSKAIDDLPPGHPTWRNKNVLYNKPDIKFKEMGSGFKAFNYDHLLGPKHIAAGYSMTVLDDGHSMRANIHHHGGEHVGSIEATRAASPVLKDRLHLETAKIDSGHRGQGLGTAAYEALFTHAKKKAGINTILGGVHSSMASVVHQKLSAKHGLNYQAIPNISRGYYDDQKQWQTEPSGEFDNKYKEYRLNLSEEELSKAIGDIKPGSEIHPKTSTLPETNGFTRPNKAYDYSHLLSPEKRTQGYVLHVGHYQPEDWRGGEGINPVVHLSHNKKIIGSITSESKDGTLKPFIAELDDFHQGQGLGQVMYEGLYAHAKHVLGLKQVKGDLHSTLASRAHQRLSAKHGLNYQAVPNPKPPKMNPGAFDNRFMPYSYELKYDEFDKKLEEWSKKK